MLYTSMGTKNKKSLEAVLAEFRRDIAHYRSESASNERIRRLLGEAIHVAFQEIKDPELRAWFCDELDKAAQVPLDREIARQMANTLAPFHE